MTKAKPHPGNRTTQDIPPATGATTPATATDPTAAPVTTPATGAEVAPPTVAAATPAVFTRPARIGQLRDVEGGASPDRSPWWCVPTTVAAEDLEAFRSLISTARNTATDAFKSLRDEFMSSDEVAGIRNAEARLEENKRDIVAAEQELTAAQEAWKQHFFFKSTSLKQGSESEKEREKELAASVKAAEDRLAALKGEIPVTLAAAIGTAKAEAKEKLLHLLKTRYEVLKASAAAREAKSRDALAAALAAVWPEFVAARIERDVATNAGFHLNKYAAID